MPSGNVGIGTTNPSGYKLNISGNANSTDYYKNGVVLHNYLFNNNGNNHSTYNDFNSPSQFGYNYIQGSTNGPSVNGAGQYYSWTMGLGAEYGFSSGNIYAAQFALPRNVGSPYLCVRYREANTWGGWNKISAGNADGCSGNFTASGSVTANQYFCDQSQANITTINGTSACFIQTNAWWYKGFVNFQLMIVGYNSANNPIAYWSGHAFWNAGGSGIGFYPDYNSGWVSIESWWDASGANYIKCYAPFISYIKYKIYG
jgi:hypothetical protein